MYQEGLLEMCTDPDNYGLKPLVDRSQDDSSTAAGQQTVMTSM